MSVRKLLAYLRVPDGDRAIRFYVEAFGGEELFRLVEPGGRLSHAELRLGEALLLLSEPFPEHGLAAPTPGQPVGITLHLHVDDADAVMARAVAAGAVVVRAASDHFYGERAGTIRDPFGYEWLVGHEIEKLTPAEMQQRYDALWRT